MKINDIVSTDNLSSSIRDLLSKCKPDEVYTANDLINIFKIKNKDYIRHMSGLKKVKLITDNGHKCFYGSDKSLQNLVKKYGGKITL